MKEITGEFARQVQIHVAGSSRTQLVSMIMGCLLLFSAMLLGGFMIVKEASNKPHGHEAWYFVAGCGVAGLLALIGPEPIAKIIVALNPWKRNGK